MFLTLLSLPYFVSLPLAFVVGAGLTVGFFLLVKMVWPGPTTDETKDVAGSIAFRVGAIHALVLGLAFATVLGEYDQAGAVVDTEAIAIVELESLLRTINDPQSDKVRKLLITYTEGVLSKGWQQMAEGKAFPVLSVLLDNIVIETYRLPAENPASLVAQKVALQILEFRVGRLFSASQRLPVIFWILGVAGFFLTLLPFGYLRSTRLNLTLIGCYGGAVFLYLYGTAAIDNPFAGTSQIDNAPYEHALEYLNQHAPRD